MKKRGGYVFSTNKNFNFNKDTLPDKVPNRQNLTIHLEKKNRGGKIVTIIKGFISNKSELKILVRELKKHCGTGGSSKNQEIIIQGNQRDKIIVLLESKGFCAKKVGS